MDNVKKEFSYQFYHTTKDAWEAMYQAILVAQKSIYWEIYIFVDDEAGARFIEALCGKARSGVEVKIVVDAIGSWALSRLAEARLNGAGAEVLRYNRLHPEFAVGRWLSRVWRRNHRKLLIIDEEIVFLGGVNIESQAFDWDDLYLKLTGRVTRALLRSFAKSYVASGGQRAAVRHLMHPKLYGELEAWHQKMRFITNSPIYGRRSVVKRILYQGLAMARESVNLMTPYFVPDAALLALMTKARLRGVKMNLFLPLRPDHKCMEWIARAYFGLIHRTGINLYLLSKMNHGKAMTIDSSSGFVGSANITPRSFYLNDEAGVFFNDKSMVMDLNTLFAQLKETAEPFDESRWKKRGWRSKAKEWWAKRIEKYV